MPNDENSNVDSDEAMTPKLVSCRPMCYCCFETLVNALKHPNRSIDSASKIGSKPDFLDKLPDPTVICPIFVTWEKCTRDESSWQLRGCIGCLSPRPLATDVAEYAMISAFRDRRFNPISLEEVPSLRVSVSLLVNYEVCKHVYDWTVGVHGILIKFVVNGHSFDGTFLPEVAKQQRWDHAHTLSSLIRKAGYSGTISQELLTKIQVTRYTSSKCQVTYRDYVINNCKGFDPICELLESKKGSSGSWSSCKNM